MKGYLGGSVIRVKELNERVPIDIRFGIWSAESTDHKIVRAAKVSTGMVVITFVLVQI